MKDKIKNPLFIVNTLLVIFVAVLILNANAERLHLPLAVEHALAAIARITGSGTANNLAAFAGTANQIGDASISEDGTNVTIINRGLCLGGVCHAGWPATGVVYTPRINVGVGDVSYPGEIPTTAKSIIVTFHITSQSSRDCTLWVSPYSNSEYRSAVHGFSPNNSDDAAADTNTMILPYGSSRILKTYTSCNSGNLWGADVYFEGYMQ